MRDIKKKNYAKKIKKLINKSDSYISVNVDRKSENNSTSVSVKVNGYALAVVIASAVIMPTVYMTGVNSIIKNICDKIKK